MNNDPASIILREIRFEESFNKTGVSNYNELKIIETRIVPEDGDYNLWNEPKFYILG
jgi:hypothetical protein